MSLDMKGTFPLDKFAQLRTPFYYYDMELLRQTLDAINSEAHRHEGFVVHYAVTANANSYQADWLNAEVIDARNVLIYQYYPGGHITLWRLTKHGGILRGDVDEDGTVNIADVTALIDYLLSGNADGINLDNADCDQDSNINIADVTSLIDYLLSGTW